MDIKSLIEIVATTGSTQNIDVDGIASVKSLFRITGTKSLGSDYSIAPNGTPTKNQCVIFYNEAILTLNGHNFIIFGKTVPTSFAAINFTAECIYNGSSWVVLMNPGFEDDGFIQAADLAADSVITSKILDLNVTTAKINDAAVTNAKLANMATNTIKGNDSAGPDVPQDLTMSELRTLLAQKLVLAGDVTSPSTTSSAAGTITSTTTIANNAVTTAKILAANVTTAKLEANLTYEVLNLEISFEDGKEVPSVGDFKIKIPYPGTVSEIYAYCTKAIEGTDNGTIIAKNNAGTTMTNGTVTFTASDARGTAYTVSPSANNTFVAGDILTFTSAKTTAGGWALLSIKVVRS